MGTTIAAVQALCPLCGSPVLSVGRSGRVFAEDLRPIQLGTESAGATPCATTAASSPTCPPTSR